MSKEAVHFTTFRFDEADRVQIRGVHYRVKPRPDGLGYIFTDVDQRLKPYKPSSLEVAKLIEKRHLNVDRMWFAEDDAVRNAQSIDISNLPAYAASRFMMVTKFLEGWEEGKWSKTELGAQKFYDAWDELQGKQRGGTVKYDWDPLTRVTPRQFLNHVEKFLFNGQNPQSLILLHRGKSGQPSPFDPVREVADEYIDMIPNAKRPRAARYFSKFLEDPRISALPEEQRPKKRTFQRWAADRLSDVHIALAHKGADVAKDEFQMTGAGQRRFKPLERIEIDETKLDVMKLLKGTRLDGLIDEQTKKKIKAMRFWASIAIDVGTKSILALRILDSDPGGRSGIETLAMAVSPKGEIALFAGSECSWPMSGQPDMIATDSGAAFNQKNFQKAVVSLCNAHLIPPVRNARYRGTIERYFRTQNQRYMELFTGRTFGNPIARGAYDSEAHASMNFEEFARCLVRLIVDAYHNTPHEGINNMTPLDAWTTMTAKYQVRPLDKNHERIFDVNVYDQHIGRNGVKFLGIPYFDKRLQKIYNNYKHQKVDIRVNRWDLGTIRISTATRDGYFDLKTPIPGFDNVSVTHWRVAQEWMNKRFSHEGQKNLAIVRRALKATEHDAEVAEEKNNVASHLITQTDLLKFNREFKSDLFQPKAGQDWGDYVPAELEETSEELPPSVAAPRSASSILGPTATGPLDPDRFDKARREAGILSPSLPGKPRQPKPASGTDLDRDEARAPEPTPEKKTGKRAPLFNPDWKSDEK